MLLTSRPARSPFTHLERVKFAPPCDVYPSVRLRSPVNVNLPSDGDSLVSPIPVPTLTSPKSPYDFQQRARSVPLRVVTNVLNQAPAEFKGRLMDPHLETPGGDTTKFNRARRRDPSVPKRVRFQGVEIIPPSPISPPSAALPPFEDVHGPSGSLGIHVQGNLPTISISIFSDENTSFHSEHINAFPAPEHETSAVDEFPDSPSVYSPTPPNSSAPPTFDFSGRGPLELVEPDRVVPCTRNDQSPSVRLSGNGPSDELHDGGRSRRKDIPLSVSKDISDAVADERAPAFWHGNLTEASSWWGHVSAVVAMLSTQNMWGKRARSAADEFASIR